MSSECGICVATIKPKELVCCPFCNYKACTSCQKTFDKPCCMNCMQVFPKSFVRAVLSKKYEKEVYRPYIQDQRIQAEKQLLPQAQPFVDWEIQKDAILSRRRFNDRTPIPPKPKIPEIYVGQNTSFPCPDNACRGFVFKNECGVCKARVCSRCHERHTQEPHVCNEDTVMTITSLMTTTKPCPSCNTAIHRISGCDHMRCTNCGVHFMYSTLRILAASTNHHYDDIPLIAQLRNNVTADELCDIDLQDSIPKDVFEEHVFYEVAIQYLYEDKKIIQYIKESKFDERAILERHNTDLHNLRVKFLMKKVPEKQWFSKIMNAYDARDKGLAYAGILHILIVSLKQMQRDMYRGEMSLDDMLTNIKNLYAMMDANLSQIQEEFGGVGLRVRKDALNYDDPPIML